jgi:murein DD-endopeptidase MepM/ murein hydrolase activator NlpD
VQYQPQMTRRQALTAERLAQLSPTTPPPPVSAQLPPGSTRPVLSGSRVPVSPVPVRSSDPRRFTYASAPATVFVRQPSRHRFALTGPLTLAAMVFTSALTLTAALPAYAVPVTAEGNTVPVYDPVTVHGADTEKVQTLTVENVTIETFQRDGYSVVAPPPPPPPSIPEVTGLSTAQAESSGSGGFDVRWPFASPSPISSGFGPRKAPCSGCSSNHKGLDFNPGSGTPIQAIAGGVVRSAVSSDSGLGVHVVIEHEIDGTKVTSTYGHMLFGSLAVGEGQTIAAGDPVGRVGNTGASTGAHLHLEVAIGGKQIDPYAWLKAFAG